MKLGAIKGDLVSKHTSNHEKKKERESRSEEPNRKKQGKIDVHRSTYVCPCMAGDIELRYLNGTANRPSKGECSRICNSSLSISWITI